MEEEEEDRDEEEEEQIMRGERRKLLDEQRENKHLCAHVLISKCVKVRNTHKRPKNWV